MPSRFEKSIVLPDSDCPAQVADLQSNLAVVCTHPWGPLGGNMHNNVVLAVALYFQRHGVTTLRFNFRGSQIGRGNKQVTQVQEAASYLLKETTTTKYILLVGYSYGSLIASSASADIPECVGCVSIAPPWGVKHWLLLFHSNHHMDKSAKRKGLPKLFVIGDSDNFTPEPAFQETVKTFHSATGAVLKNADHFFARREKDLMSIIGQWLLQTYPMLQGDLSNLGQVEFLLHDLVLGNNSSLEDPSSPGYCVGMCANPTATRQPQQLLSTVSPTILEQRCSKINNCHA